MDFGTEGMSQLIAVPNGMDVQHFGAGFTYSEAMKPILVCHKGIRFGFLSFSWKPIESVGATPNKAGVALIPQADELCQAVTCLREKCDHVVVSFHWGYEYERYPLPLHRKLAHAVVDAGASVVVGHHSHVYQGIEAYKQGLIYYSLGNCYMAWPVKPQGDIGIIPIVQFDAKSVSQVALLYAVRDRVTNVFRITDNHELDPTIETLSEPLHLGGNAYEHFFRRNRVRRRGLPVFTGTWVDSIRYAWLDIRSCLIRAVVRLGLWQQSLE